jgi:glucose-6-phosphate isomerase
VIKKLKRQRKTDKEIEKLHPHKTFEGNLPTNSLLFKKMRT